MKIGKICVCELGHDQVNRSIHSVCDIERTLSNNMVDGIKKLTLYKDQISHSRNFNEYYKIVSGR